MSLFVDFFQLIINFVVGIFNQLNIISFPFYTENGYYNIFYGWFLVAAICLVIITNMFWRGGQK